MGLTKRLVDLARANLNALLDRAADVNDPRRRLLDLSDSELEAEILRRKAARDAEAKVAAARAAVDEPGASRSGAGAASTSAPPPTASPDRAAREQAAREREAKVAAARAAREQAARDAQTARDAQAKARGGGASGGGGRASTGGGGGGGGGARRPAGPDLSSYYARLELPVGAPFEDVKAAYRRLMRRYHPDLHSQTPEKLKAATEVAQALTQAYNELEKALLGGPNRK